jgi:hypothetical protein
MVVEPGCHSRVAKKMQKKNRIWIVTRHIGRRRLQIGIAVRPMVAVLFQSCRDAGALIASQRLLSFPALFDLLTLPGGRSGQECRDRVLLAQVFPILRLGVS